VVGKIELNNVLFVDNKGKVYNEIFKELKIIRRCGMRNRITGKLKNNLVEIKRRFEIKEIGVFGSCIKGKAKKGSDIDILVEFEEGHKTFDNYMELKFFLEELFNRKVDLILKNALKEGIKPYILPEVIYV